MSKITTHLTAFERPDLLKAALEAMGATYQVHAPIPGAYAGVPVDYAIGGQNFGHYRGIGYTFDQEAGRLALKIDDMDLVSSPGPDGRTQFAPLPKIVEFETRLHNYYNLALLTEMLAQGQAGWQHTVLDDGTILLDVTDYALGGA